MRLPQEHLETAHRAVGGADPGVIGDVVAVVLQGRGIEGQEPEDSDPEVLQIVELLGKPGKVADPISVAVVKGADVDLIDDRVFVPEGIVRQPEDVRRHSGHHPGRRATGEPEIPDPALHSTLGVGRNRTSVARQATSGVSRRLTHFNR